MAPKVAFFFVATFFSPTMVCVGSSDFTTCILMYVGISIALSIFVGCLKACFCPRNRPGATQSDRVSGSTDSTRVRLLDGEVQPPVNIDKLVDAAVERRLAAMAAAAPQTAVPVAMPYE